MRTNTTRFLALFVALATANLNGLAAGPRLGHPDFMPSREHPIGWRGDGTGRFPGADPVIAWDIKKGINVLWRIPTSKFSNATPLIVGDKLIVGREGYYIVCLDKMTGEPVWLQKWQPKPITDKETINKELRYQPGGRVWSKGKWNYGDWMGSGMPTPVCDGRLLWVKNGGKVICFDLDGNRQWVTETHLIQSDHPMNVPSPLLVEGVIVAEGGSTDHWSKHSTNRLTLPKRDIKNSHGGKLNSTHWMVGVSADTGKLLWDVGPIYAGGYDGPSSPCAVYVGEGDRRKAYVLTGEGQMFDPLTGKLVMMSVGSRGPFSSPVSLGNRVIYNHMNYIHMLEVTLKAPAEPQVRKVWGAGGPAAMGGGVVFYNGFVYTADPLDGGRMSAHVYDGTNGRHIFSTGTLPYKYKKTVFDYPSPVTSARHAFVFNDRYCAVLEQAPNPKLVAINTYERMFAGVFLDGDRIYMRTYDSIICIGPKGQEGADYANEAPRRIELAELAMVAAGNKFNRRDQAVAYINKHHANEPAALVMALDFIEKENQFTNALALLPECITDANRGGFVSAVKAQLAERPPAEKERLYRLLPPAGGDAALAILTGALAGDAPETRLAAARTLGRWPDEKPLAGLQAVVESQAAKDLRTTALRAMLGILETGGLDVQKKQAALTGLVTAATELKMLPEVFGAAARLPTPAAMAFLGRYVRDARTGNDAAAAMVACAEIAEPEHLKELVQSFGAHAKEAGSAPARKQLDAALPVLKERLSNVPPKIGDDDSIKLLDLDF